MDVTPSLLERVRALAPMVEASADEMEHRAALTDEVAAAVRESGAIHLMVPEEFGGDELGIVGTIEVIEELARQDGSVGWSTMAASVSTAFSAIYTSDDVARALFGTDRGAILAGQLAPMGRADVDGDGYVISGSYRFGSGSDQTTHMLGGCLVYRDGEMVMRDNGMPDVVAAVVPNDKVEFKGNWDVMGLSGTASVDYEIAPIRVGAGEVFSIFTEVPERGSDMHRLGVMVLTAAGHAGWALGVARRALDEIASIAATKVRMSDSLLGEQQVFQVGFAEAEAKVRAARAFVLETFAAAEAEVASGERLSARTNHLTRLATTWATTAAAEAVEWAYREAGTESLRNPSVLGRCFRDMNAATQHVMVGRKTLTDAAVELLGVA
ncbi:MAG: acyl-CoA dehydrogenase family protein [Acidimicrobiales bacterium]|jgi:alkylation response protein AidB-like acyl-CoA dehydrogenase|nr:acyl-CoA dehydrogenase family protein [Acidimicrobiales bacterium]